MYVVWRTDSPVCLVHCVFTRRINEESTIMLWTILIVLLALWLVGFYGGFVTTSLIHLLLLGAAIVLAFNLLRHRNPA